MGGTTLRRPFRRALGRIALAALLIAPATVLQRTDAGADHGTSKFELEGDVVDSPAGAPFDWTSFFSNTGARSPVLPDATRPNFTDSGFDADFAFPDQSTYTGGSKDVLDVPGWSCTDSNNLGGKFDILNAYSVIHEDNLGVRLYFGIERAATEGDGNMGFWFLKDSSVDCELPPGHTGKAPAFTGAHQDGDIFVVASFSNGGTKASITAYKWVKNATQSFLDIANPIVSLDDALCTASTPPHAACGVVNTQPLAVPWPAPDKNGGDLDANAFYEGFVFLPASQVSGCFATFVANTRSSTSPTSTIHDFSRGSFLRCSPGTQLKLKQYKINAGTAVTTDSSTPATITVFKGDSLELVFAEKNDGNFTLDKPNVGRYVVIPNTTQAGACSLTDVLSGGFNVGDSNTNSKLDPNETWEYKCTVSIGDSTPTTLVAYGHGIDALTAPPTKKDITVCTTPSSTNPVLAPATVCVNDPDEITTVNLSILAPSTAMEASASLEIIFFEKNDSNAALTKPGDGDFVRQLASVCDTFGQVVQTASDPHPGKNVGDPDGDGVLDPTEEWRWRCVITIAKGTSGTKSVTALGHGLSGIFDVTFCTNGTTADQVVKLGDNATNASPICDPHERRKVTLTIE